MAHFAANFGSCFVLLCSWRFARSDDKGYRFVRFMRGTTTVQNEPNVEPESILLGRKQEGARQQSSPQNKSMLSPLISFLAADVFSLASFAAAFAPNNQPPAALHLHHHELIRNVSANDVPSSSLSNGLFTYPSLAISDTNLPGLPEERSQDQQIQAALPLGGTVRDTKWRVREERGPAFLLEMATVTARRQDKRPIAHPQSYFKALPAIPIGGQLIMIQGHAQLSWKRQRATVSMERARACVG